MRKCDICSTQIPLGTDRCPSCGYRFKPERKLNQEVRAQRKAAYMAQFQPHPSPLDDLKNKFGSTHKRKVSTIQDADKTRKIIKRFIIGFITVAILLTALPIGIGVFLGIREVFSEESYFEEESFFGDEFEYEWVNSYEELRDTNSVVADSVVYYRDFVFDKMDDYNRSGYEYSLYESYNVYGDELDYGYISTVLEVGDEYVDIAATKYSIDDDWVVVYSMSDFLDDGVLRVDETITNALANISGYSFAELAKCVNSYVLDYQSGDMYGEYQIGDATFSIDFYDDEYLDVAITLPIE